MNSARINNEKLKNILRHAYRKKEEIGAGDLSFEDLMRHIRQAGPIQMLPPFFEMFEPLVWKLPSVACLFILAFTALLLTLDFTSAHNLFEIFMNGKDEITLAQLFEF